MKHIVLALIFLFLVHFSFSQPTFTRNDNIPVKANNILIPMPWVGGHNFCQFSDIDLNFDSIPDLFVFDRTGDKITTYINKGTPNTVDYIYQPQYAQKFPKLGSWAILLDYNCDGKEDIFTYAINVAGIKVYRNDSDPVNGLKFSLVTPYIKSNYHPSSITNLYVSSVDIPSIEDMDNDGDMDVVTFHQAGTILELHKNLSQENGYGCDSLIFKLDINGCWGNFSEDPLNCSIHLNQSCGMVYPYIPPPLYETTNSHSGSCSLCLDMDGDKDKDIILGDVSCCTMTMLINGGTSTSANMISMDDSFPSNTKIIQAPIFPCAYFLDVNNDGKRDMIVSPNQANISLNKQSIWYYKNINSDSAPVFSFVKDNFLQDAMIDVGEGASATFFDYNSDGLQDLLIGTYNQLTDSCPGTEHYNITAFKNTGTRFNPAFDLDTADFFELSIQLSGIDSANFSPAFGDLDNDGDPDMMVGSYNGGLHYFENTAGLGNAANFILTQANYPDNFADPIDIGNYSVPQIIDANRDGMLDLIIGEKGGNINYYENTGTPLSPVFTFITDSFGRVDVRNYQEPSGYSIPCMFDYNGNYMLLVGSVSGYLYCYKNIDGNLSGNFTLADSMFQNIWGGIRNSVTVKDINGDYVLDMMTGNYCGGVSFYKGTDTLTTHIQNDYSKIDFTLFPNPANEIVHITFSDFFTGNISLCNIYGQQLIKTSITHSKTVHIRTETLAGGTYFCHMETPQWKKVKVVVVVK